MRQFGRSQRKILGPVVLVLVCLAGFWCGTNRAETQGETVTNDADSASVEFAAAVQLYLQELKPLFRQRCYACHGALKQEAGLRLDTVSFMKIGGDSGPVIDSNLTNEGWANNLLFERVSASEPFLRMPPEHEGGAFSAAQLETLRRWLASGAPGPAEEKPEADPSEHWAFQRRVRPEIPTDNGRANGRNPIDAFLAKAHAEQGLVPSEEAPRNVLIRRLYLDLIGLPPTLEEWTQLAEDAAPTWYEDLVTRLLEDPRHGERWARHWMDVWRYSDWWGLGNQLRNSQKHIWHWRDWIVESLNEDVPYDEMIRQMLAADELYPNDLQKLRASGYLARNYFLFNRHQWMDETVEHVGKGFLGLTLNCAKCHDHKYDPITQVDYYRMRAIFEPYHVRLDVRAGEPDLERDGIPRAFDGLLDTPTYLFIRGQESQPDKNSVIEPGVPKFLAPDGGLAIRLVDLPRESWQPERRPWIVTDALSAAEKRIAQANEDVDLARTELTKAEQPLGKEAMLARAKLILKVRSLEQAMAERDCIQRRATAMRIRWERDTELTAENSKELDAKATTAARHAARSERELEVARMRTVLAELQIRHLEAKPDQREAVEKELATGQETLSEAERKLEDPGEEFASFTGAQWTATRFLYSTRDDPTVEFPSTSTGRRTALAEWITDDAHPLTARVAVNQLWMRHMGAPLISSVFDFGRAGALPNHPELLDWLASELVESGWSMKHLHRLIVTSAAYRRNSSLLNSEENTAKDPDNDHWWRRTPIRLESQVIRDSILALSGTLDNTLGGPSVPPAEQENSTRRSLYFFHSNNDRHLFLTVFDEALVKECYRREQSIVPQQALALSNSQLVHDASRRIAKRLTEGEPESPDSGLTDAEFVRRAFKFILGMEVRDKELAASLGTLQRWQIQRESANSDDEFDDARTYLVWALLNHNDFVTLR